MLEFLLGRWRDAQSRRRAVRELQELPDNVLRDLGATRETIDDYLNRRPLVEDTSVIGSSHTVEIIAFPKSRCLSHDPDCCKAA